MSATQQIINIGVVPNDGLGDPLRTAFSKINNNFSNLFASFINTSNIYTNGNTAGQVIFEAPANTFTQGQFYIQSSNPLNQDSQTIQLYAQTSNDQTQVKFTGYGSTFFGNCLATFDMTVDNVSGNVRILCNPLVSNGVAVLHFIGSEILWIGEPSLGQNIALDGYENSVMATEQNNPINTEQ